MLQPQARKDAQKKAQLANIPSLFGSCPHQAQQKDEPDQVQGPLLAIPLLAQPEGRG